MVLALVIIDRFDFLLQVEVVLGLGSDEGRALSSLGLIVVPLDCALPLFLVAWLIWGNRTHLRVDKSVS